MRAIFTSLAFTLLASACGAKVDAPAGPAPREGDPALEHTWTMPAQSSALASGDLGSTPPQLAAALMKDGRMPSMAHRIAQYCAATDALRGADAVALRFAVLEESALGKIEADPPDAAGGCLAEALRDELAKLDDMPAGAALLRIRLHGSASR